MAVNDHRWAGPFRETILSDRVTAATDLPMPLSFEGDTDTGLMRPAANTMAVITGGVEAVRFTSGALVQFAAASNTANGTGVFTITTVAPASAGTTIAGWIRAQASDGSVIFIPYAAHD